MLILAIAVALAGGAAALLGGGENWLRVLFAIPLILIVPGYTIVSAVFTDREFDSAGTLLLTVGVSIIVAILSGIAMDWLPWGLQPASWALWLCAVSVIAGVWSLLHPPTRDYQTSVPARLNRRSLLHALLFTPALVLAAAAVALASVGVSRLHQPGFSQLWVLRLADPSQNILRIGVRSHEAIPYTFRVTLAIHGHVIRKWQPIYLEPKGTWQVTVQVANTRLNNPRLHVLLYRLDHPGQIYRHVFTYLNNSNVGTVHT